MLPSLKKVATTTTTTTTTAAAAAAAAAATTTSSTILTIDSYLSVQDQITMHAGGSTRVAWWTAELEQLASWVLSKQNDVLKHEMNYKD